MWPEIASSLGASDLGTADILRAARGVELLPRRSVVLPFFLRSVESPLLAFRSVASPLPALLGEGGPSCDRFSAAPVAPRVGEAARLDAGGVFGGEGAASWSDQPPPEPGTFGIAGQRS